MIRALVTIGFLQLVAMVLLLVRTKILAVTVGLDGVGAMSAIDKLTAVISQTLSLSLPFAAVRFLPAALRDSPGETELLYRRMRFVLVALIVPATLVCIVLALTAPTVWGRALLPYQRTVMLAFACLPVTALVPFLTNAYAGMRGHVASMRFTVLHAVVLVLAALAAGLGWGINGFYTVYGLIGVAVVVVVAARLRPPGVVGARPRLPLTDALRLPPAMWRFATWLLVLTFAAPYAAWYVQYTTLRLFGADSSGILQGAIGISLSVRALLGAAHAIFLTPQVNRQAAVADRMAWANEFQRNTALLFVATLPPLLLFADVVLRVLYASPFAAAAPFVALFVAAEVITLLSGTYQALIIAGDRMGFHVAQNLVAQALLAGTAALALPRVGIAGAGIAVLTAPAFLYITTVVFLRREYGARVSPEASGMVLLTAALVLVCGLIGSQFTGLSLQLLGAKAVACVAIWLVAYLVMPAEDRGRLRAMIERATARIARRGDVT